MVCIESAQNRESRRSTLDARSQHREVDDKMSCNTVAALADGDLSVSANQQAIPKKPDDTVKSDLCFSGHVSLVKPSDCEIPPNLNVFTTKEFVSFCQEKSEFNVPQTKRDTLPTGPVSVQDAFVEFVRKRLPLIVADSAVRDLLQSIPSSPRNSLAENIEAYLTRDAGSGLLSSQHLQMLPCSISGQTVLDVHEVSKQLHEILSAFRFLSTNTATLSGFDCIAVAAIAISALEGTGECILRIMADAFPQSESAKGIHLKAHELFSLRQFLRTRSSDSASDMLRVLRRVDAGQTTYATKPRIEEDSSSSSSSSSTASSTSASSECLVPARGEKAGLSVGLSKTKIEVQHITSPEESAAHTALPSTALYGLQLNGNSIREYVSKRLPNENAVVDWSLFNQMVGGSVGAHTEVFGSSEQSGQATLPANIPASAFSAVTEMRNTFQDGIPTTYHPAFSQLPAFARLGKQHVQTMPAATSNYSTTSDVCAPNKETYANATVAAAQALNMAAEESRRRVAAAEARAMQSTNVGQRGRLAQWGSTSLVARNGGLVSNAESLDRSRSFDMAMMRRSCRDPSVASIEARGQFYETQRPTQDAMQYQLPYSAQPGIAGVTRHLQRIPPQNWKHGPLDNAACSHRQSPPATSYGSKNSSPRSYGARAVMAPAVQTSTSMIALPEVNNQWQSFGRSQITSHQVPNASQMFQLPSIPNMAHMPSAPTIIGGSGESAAPAPIVDIQRLKRHQYPSDRDSTKGLRQPADIQQNQMPSLVDPCQHSFQPIGQHQGFVGSFYPVGRPGPQQASTTSGQRMVAYGRLPYDPSAVVMPSSYGIAHPSRSMPLGGTQNQRFKREDVGQVVGQHTYCPAPTTFMPQQCSQKASNGPLIHQQLLGPSNTVWKQQSLYFENKHFPAEPRLYAEADLNGSQSHCQQSPVAAAAVSSKAIWGYSS